MRGGLALATVDRARADAVTSVGTADTRAVEVRWGTAARIAAQVAEAAARIAAAGWALRSREALHAGPTVAVGDALVARGAPAAPVAGEHGEVGATAQSGRARAANLVQAHAWHDAVLVATARAAQGAPFGRRPRLNIPKYIVILEATHCCQSHEQPGSAPEHHSSRH